MWTFEEAWELAKKTGDKVGFGEHAYSCRECGKPVKLSPQRVDPDGKTWPNPIKPEYVRCFDCTMGVMV